MFVEGWFNLLLGKTHQVRIRQRSSYLEAEGIRFQSISRSNVDLKGMETKLAVREYYNKSSNSQRIHPHIPSMGGVRAQCQFPIFICNDQLNEFQIWRANPFTVLQLSNSRTDESKDTRKIFSSQIKTKQGKTR